MKEGEERNAVAENMHGAETTLNGNFTPLAVVDLQNGNSSLGLEPPCPPLLPPPPPPPPPQTLNLRIQIRRERRNKLPRGEGDLSQQSQPRRICDTVQVGVASFPFFRRPPSPHFARQML